MVCVKQNLADDQNSKNCLKYKQLLESPIPRKEQQLNDQKLPQSKLCSPENTMQIIHDCQSIFLDFNYIS